MTLIFDSGGPPPIKSIPKNLSSKDMLLYAAWAHGIKEGYVVHRLTLFAYVQSHIENKSVESLQNARNNSNHYWRSGEEKGTYILKGTGKDAMRSKFGDSPAQADLYAKYIFKREFEGRVFKIEVNPIDRKIELEGTDTIAELEKIGAKFTTNSSSHPRKVLNWIIQDNDYTWVRLSYPSQVTHSKSGVMHPPASNETKAQTEISSRETSQGYQISSDIRQAIEEKAMEIASDYFVNQGWKVTNVSSNHPYDLLCEMKEKVLYVEVKGTTTDGNSVLLTPNEVAYAQENFPNTALFVVSNLTVSENNGGFMVIKGGEKMLLQPWLLESKQLTATGYIYEIPKTK